MIKEFEFSLFIIADYEEQFIQKYLLSLYFFKVNQEN